MLNLGFIGLGAMGMPMAGRLRDAGYPLAIHARRAAVMQPLVARGARACASAREVAAASDVVFVMVTDSRDVEAVVLGGDGLVHGTRAGAVVIVMSTISPVTVRQLAAEMKQRGVELLDAPVSGGVIGAEAGTLSIMVGGEEAAFTRCKPLLDVLGKTIVHVGPSGAGEAAKACTQICIVVNHLGVAEAMLLGAKLGLDLEKLKQVLQGGFAASRILEVQAPKMIARTFAPETGKIESRLHHKDINIVLDLARDLGLSLPASALAAEIWTRLQQAGGAHEDSAAVLTILEQASGE
jgi:3-hydroxyisobutyrate dehydrogenase-like beta-hydroxyacid dehydrogenase